MFLWACQVNLSTAHMLRLTHLKRLLVSSKPFLKLSAVTLANCAVCMRKSKGHSQDHGYDCSFTYSHTADAAYLLLMPGNLLVVHWVLLCQVFLHLFQLLHLFQKHWLVTQRAQISWDSILSYLIIGSHPQKQYHHDMWSNKNWALCLIMD